jgi:tyrosyl-tRNA synthetase
MTVLQPPVEEQLRLLMRGVEYGDPQLHATMEEELRQRLQEGRPLRVYCGFDPTAPDLHLGSLVPMLKMRQFQRLGHEVTFLVGTMTGIVGDPSDKTAARRMLTPEEIEANAETWLGQAFRVLDPKLTLVKRNGDWLRDLTLNDVIQLASHFTVSQFLDRESFRQRLEAAKPIYVHEFLYALMQGYDAVAMNTDVQIGGTDQLFNILAGRILQRAHGQRPQVAVCTPILVGTDGHLKMSKSVGNYVGLDEPPSEMYGKVMSIPDSLIGDYFTLLTEVPEEEVAALRRDLDSRAASPMEAKKRLAREIVALLNSEAAAGAAQAEFERVFQRREAPEESAIEVAWSDMPLADGQLALPAFVARFARLSMSEARRLIGQGAVQVDGALVSGRTAAVQPGSVIRVGRHHFFRITDA